MAGVGERALDHPLLKASQEALNKAFRTAHRTLEREILQAVTKFNDLAKSAAKGGLSVADAARSLAEVEERLAALKRKMAEYVDEEESILRRCKARLEHVRDIHGDAVLSADESDDHAGEDADEDTEVEGPPPCDSTSIEDSSPPAAAAGAGEHAQGGAEAMRLNAFLVEHLFREGLLDTASRLARESGVDELSDEALFRAAREVEGGLLRHDCTAALEWCADNKSRLKKMESSLEFSLRLQEFVELARQGRRMDAIKYARKHLAGAAESHMADVQQAMALLAFDPSTSCPRYCSLYEEARWDVLVAKFRHDHLEMYSQTAQSLLHITLQAGLSALKTPMCYSGADFNRNCPVCFPLLNAVASELPYSHRVHSSLVCRISGAIMDEHNPPMALPNGNVYSRDALVAMARENDGNIIDPRDHTVVPLSSAKKVFIM